jgi:hypothetical protein
MEHMEQGLNVEDAVKRLVNQDEHDKTATGPKDSTEDKGTAAEEVVDLNLIKTDPDKLYPLIYYAIKRKLKEWEQSMAERPGTSRNTQTTGDLLTHSDTKITSSTLCKEKERQRPKCNLGNISNRFSNYYAPG